MQQNLAVLWMMARQRFPSFKGGNKYCNEYASVVIEVSLFFVMSSITDDVKPNYRVSEAAISSA